MTDTSWWGEMTSQGGAGPCREFELIPGEKYWGLET